MDIDWMDELIHTPYGKKWLDAFLAEAGGDQRLDDVREIARAAIFSASGLGNSGRKSGKPQKPATA